MTPQFAFTAAAAAIAFAWPAVAQEQGQDPGAPGLEALAAAIGNTQVTWRRHDVPAGGRLTSAEGTACPGTTKMLSGACHPGFSDQVILINQFPNVGANTWRCGFENNSSVSRSAWVYTLCAADQPSGPPPVVHNLTVRRYTTTSLSNADTDRILGDGNDVAQVADFPGDVACNIEMRRSGNVSAFTTGDGSLDTAAEFNAVIGLSGWVKAVNQINWCGSIGAGIIGCAPVPGSSLTVVRFTPSLEGILWLHEFAHNKGRGHRNGTQNVMHPSIGSSRLGLNAAECTALSVASATGAEAGLVLASGSGEGAATDHAHGAEGAIAPPDDVRDFVRQHFFHGVPYDVARSYGSEDVPALLEMLDDPAEEEWWVNTVAVLGMIATEDQAFEPLVGFLEEDGGVLSREAYRAKATVPLALGYLAHQAESEAAVDYLIAATDPGFWSDREVGRATFQASTDERDADMVTKAVLGLALSGSDRAFEALQDLQAGERAGDAGFVGVVAESLSANRTIAEEGLSEYYDGQ